MARVSVTDDIWADFRIALGHRSVSDALGAFVEGEVERYRSRRVREGQLEPRELVDALEQARRQRDDLAAIVERLEALDAQAGESARR